MELPRTLLSPSSGKKKKKKNFTPKKCLIFQEMELCSSKIKKFLIFQEIELSSSKIEKTLIFLEIELSSLIFFLYFRK